MYLVHIKCEFAKVHGISGKNWKSELSLKSKSISKTALGQLLQETCPTHNKTVAGLSEAGC